MYDDSLNIHGQEITAFLNITQKPVNIGKWMSNTLSLLLYKEAYILDC